MRGSTGPAARIAAAALWLAATLAHAAAPSIDDFFGLPLLGDAELSPSGRYLAVLIGGSTAARARLGILDLDERDKPPKTIARFPDADVAGVQWLDDDRLVFSSFDGETLAERRGVRGLWAIDRDGSGLRQLINRRWREGGDTTGTRIERRVLEVDHQFGGVIHDGSGDALVLQGKWDNRGDFQGTRVLRLDTRTGMTRVLATGPDAYVEHWVVDAKGEARAALSRSGGMSRLYWRAAGQADWTLLSEDKTDGFTRVTPLWVDGDTLYVEAAHGRKGLGALYRYDTAQKKLDAPPLFEIDGFDYQGGHETDLVTGRVVGIHYDADAPGSHWFDPALQAAQREVDAQLKGTINRLACSRCTGATRLLVRSFSDRQPTIYSLYDTRTRKLETLGASRPSIDPKQMATQDFVVVKARDGRDIPTYVTKPPGRSDAPRPAVVLVHGGPQVRGNSWGWHAQAQFLASRGYVVIEPEFRGSAGYGWAHLSAGFRQWGLAMQDDVTDATRWAVREAGVDAQRICIAGASYGGYATLMGLVREPALYRCGIDWVGVTDPGLLFSIHWSDQSDEWKTYGLARMLGDPVADKERLAQTSPVAQAARITQPLLLAYGAADRRVPIEHGKRLRDAVSATNRDVEWVVYADEGHGWTDPKNIRDFWGRVEAFLDRTIGASAAKTAGAPR